MRKRWITAEHDSEAAALLAKAGALPLVFCRLMLARGLHDTEEIKHFCEPRLSELSDPFTLNGVREAAERILAALANKKRICVFGDYDVDGITASALMVQVLREAGGDISVFIPSRMDEGYGLSLEAVERCMAEYDPELLITVDCGTNSVDSAAFLREKVVELIITDHHTPAEQLADADVMVNPKCGGSEAVHMLAGVGVAFKLCHGLVKLAKERHLEAVAEIDLREYLGLVALGTVCDVVPLKNENRILSRHGIRQLAKGTCPGVKALLQVARVNVESLSAYHVGYQLGPRLNAAGRLADATASLDLLTSNDAARAEELAKVLDMHNRDRQKVESDAVVQACRMIDERFNPENDYGLVVANPEWHPGVVGIVASRLVRKYRRPVAVIALDENGEGHGSCRSVESFDMVKGLRACGAYLEKYGGHAMAAGFTLKKEQVPAFTQAFNEYAGQCLAGEDLRERVRVDAWVEMRDLNTELFWAVERLRPFGVGNPRPIWALSGVELIDKKKIGGKHCRITITDGINRMTGIFFGCLPEELPVGCIDVAFTLIKNTFRGQNTLELQVQDVVEH